MRLGPHVGSHQLCLIWNRVLFRAHVVIQFRFLFSRDCRAKGLFSLCQSVGSAPGSQRLQFLACGTSHNTATQGQQLSSSSYKGSTD